MWIKNKVNKKLNKLKIRKNKFNFWFVKKKYFLINFSFQKKIILFFFPTDINSISGGILSLTSIQNEIRKLSKIHKCQVYCTFLPSVNNEFYKYIKFESNLVIFNFDEITKYYKKLNYLEVHIPDIFVSMFDVENKNFETFFDWILNVEKLKINILNQNDLLMPSLEQIEKLNFITTNITMTVAHEKYASLEKRSFYKMPLHLFSPWTSPTPYVFKKYKEKKDLIIISPDIIDQKLYSNNYTKEQIINKIQIELPNFEVVIIENLSYNEYKNMISNCKFAITFGEGLDGYFCEPIFCGSVSFAVFNSVFFTSKFKDVPTIYENFDVLFEKIVMDIKNFDDYSFTLYNKQMNELLKEIYSLDRLKKNIKNYYLGNLDFK